MCTYLDEWDDAEKCVKKERKLAEDFRKKKMSNWGKWESLRAKGLPVSECDRLEGKLVVPSDEEVAAYVRSQRTQ